MADALVEAAPELEEEVAANAPALEEEASEVAPALEGEASKLKGKFSSKVFGSTSEEVETAVPEAAEAVPEAAEAVPEAAEAVPEAAEAVPEAAKKSTVEEKVNNYLEEHPIEALMAVGEATEKSDDPKSDDPKQKEEPVSVGAAEEISSSDTSCHLVASVFIVAIILLVVLIIFLMKKSLQMLSCNRHGIKQYEHSVYQRCHDT